MPGPDLALFWHFFGHLLVRHLYSRRQQQMSSIDSVTKQANAVLELDCVRLRIDRPNHKGTLSLRGTWASAGEEKKPQRLALGIKATAAGVEEAKEIGREAWNVIELAQDS